MTSQVPLNEYEFANQKLSNVQSQVSILLCAGVLLPRDALVYVSLLLWTCLHTAGESH